MADEERGRVRNPLALAVLGLLLESPAHPHRLAATLRERGLDEVFKVTTGSLYDVVRALQREGWIEARGTSREGRRPERTVYAHTERGREAFVAWLDQLIRVPAKEYPRFLSAVSYLGALGPVRAEVALRERARRLGERIDTVRGEWQDVVASGRAPRLHMIEVECAIHLLEAERDWVEATAGEIAAGTLTWPAAPVRPR